MKTGFYRCKIHSRQELFKVLEGKPHQLHDTKEGPKWIGTIVPTERLAKFRPITEESLIFEMRETIRRSEVE